MTLKLECWSEELSSSQLVAYEKAQREHTDIRSKLSDFVKDGENIFTGEIFSAYQCSGIVPGLEKISKTASELKNELKKQNVEKVSKNSRSSVQREKSRKASEIKDFSIEIDEDDEDDYIPLSLTSIKLKEMKEKDGKKEKEKEKLKEKEKDKKRTTSLRSAPEKVTPPKAQGTTKPCENSSVGGLAVGSDLKPKGKDSIVVDLTTEDAGKAVADSREISFNKLQGKTFPSLVVVARPSLKVKDSATSDRGVLDAKVKNVLMHTATKFTEWLIQQGLVRSEQVCLNHPTINLKLGMYSDASKFPYSGGYVWISDCCQSRFVSVFNGSLFEGSPNPPSVLLKLIYHWACQTNVQNVVQWVKVDNLYVKGLYTWLRSICTVALHQHMTLLGGIGRRIEVGVISLGTTTQDGQQRQVKVEVLGVLDHEAKLVRLRAVEPLNEGERNYKKRFSKILEPLTSWVHKDSIILTDLTVDKTTLMSMGYKIVHQSSANDTTNRNNNANIMDYLRRIVPRMFQNTLSLLSRQIIQQFLDELVWREWYGTTPGQAFDNVVSHIAEQTRFDSREPLVQRLNKVAGNPFKNWSYLAVKSPPIKEVVTPSTSTTPKRNRKRGADTSVPIIQAQVQPPKKPYIEKKDTKKTKEKPKKSNDVLTNDDMISLEGFYYGLVEDNTKLNSYSDINLQCPECDEIFFKTTDYQDHIFSHANPFNQTDTVRCRYCLENWANPEALRKHILLLHPIDTKNSIASTFNCIICENRFSTTHMLATHMAKVHQQFEMPYKCGVCKFKASSHHMTVDHYYEKHSESGKLQCPVCLKTHTIIVNDEIIIENVRSFLEHIRFHTNKTHSRKCTKCSLIFLQRGILKVHQMYDHHSYTRETLIQPLCSVQTNIVRPKIKPTIPQNTNLLYKLITSYSNYTIIMKNGKICLECGLDFDDDNHMMGLLKCQKCNYHTACLPGMLEHCSNCTGGLISENSIISSLDMEMHCICGFSSSDGNALARHLATCDRKSAYSSAEAVQDNTVKRNMLDMLGLVRKADETDDNSEDVQENTENIPSTSEADEDNKIQMEIITETQEETNADTSMTQEYEPASEIMETGEEQFNTQLSLDDLGPPSVLPPSLEPDRTPHLKEYQSLATPRVHMEIELNQSSYDEQQDLNPTQ